jgi:hypothetical protein
MNNALRTNRRGFLKGVGACVALPVLESFLPRTAFASAVTTEATGAVTATGAPLRTAFITFPNGAIPAAWASSGEGAALQLGKTLQPLEPVRNLVQVFGGLDLQAALAGPDGAGDHARGSAALLTTVRLNKSASDLRVGVSIDQEIAGKVGQQTRLPSLELSADRGPKSGACDSGYACAYQYNVSWKTATTPMAPEHNPRLVFERLFGEGAPGQRAESLARRRAEQRSVLDFVMAETESLNRKASVADRAKLDEYLTAVREIERRIEASERFADAPDPGREAPQGIPRAYEEHVAQMFDLLALAFETDSTRVATFQLAHDGSNRSFDHIGISEGHHELTHHRNNQGWVRKIEEIDRWYVGQFARFLKTLDDKQDIDGKSMLYNSQIVYASGNSDGNRHTHVDLPVVLAGGGGGVYQTGRHVHHGATPLANLYLRMAQNAGLTGLERFGDSTAPLANL